MRKGQPKTVYLRDYTPPAYRVAAIHLTFELGEEATVVTAVAQYQRSQGVAADTPLVLDGEEVELLGLKLDGQPLAATAYQVDATSLTVPAVPETFTLEVTTRLYPQRNTALEGLYRSGGKFCTQCEAQGFRKITYYPDRPDVLAVFTTEIYADKQHYPVLLANGNLVAHGDLPDGRHWVRWHDPFPKPCYLFALVAGDLQYVEDQYTTASGRAVTLRLYTEAHNIPKCGYAMGALKRAMRWDEERFGLEYDLDIYMIVAVDDFNMGAMENKGLNLFNSKLVFASPETATDVDYVAIEAVIGHEYFHNWTGNRVTCRDWFQLSLKEGLTVFRDQEFTGDLHDRAVKRISDVRFLRMHQFPEDASPMAHPVRPPSYIEINNFYTVTVYEKGAEVVRMYQTLLGREGFRKGMDLYIQRHDGQAVTTEDFLHAMADANGVDLAQFQRWYEQAGTPQVTVQMTHDAATQTCTLQVSQHCPPTPEAQEKQPFLIPLAVGLLDREGRDLIGTQVLWLRERTQNFTFHGIAEPPLPSLLRDFSAPVQVDYPYSDADLAFLMAHDSDPFNCWDAGQRLAMRVFCQGVQAWQAQEAFGISHAFVSAFQAVLNNAALEPAFRAEALTLPGEGDIVEATRPADPASIHAVREQVLRTLAAALRLDWEHWYETLQDTGEYAPTAAAIGQRTLKNLCLSYLGYVADEGIPELCWQQYRTANNMTDVLAALAVLNRIDCPQRAEALQDFYDRWQHEPLVLDKWLALHATSPLPGALARVQELLAHPRFDIRNPNRVRALIGSFVQRNPLHFHAADGSGYAFLTEQVLVLDGINPQVTSRMVRPLMNWRHYEAGRSAKMRAALEQIAAHSGLSADVYEIVSKSLV